MWKPMTITEQLKRNTVGLEFDIESVSTFDWLGPFSRSLREPFIFIYITTGVVLFLFAGLGFFGAVGLLLTTFSRRLLFALGIPFTGIQIVLWVTSGMQRFALGVFDKSVQTLLVGLLIGLLMVDLEIDVLEEFSTWWDESDEREDCTECRYMWAIRGARELRRATATIRPSNVTSDTLNHRSRVRPERGEYYIGL
jgi:hypothetical protein